LIVQADVSKEDNVKEIFEKTLRNFKTIDILINNAAIQIRNHILDVSIEEWKAHLDINLTGAFLCSKEALKVMINNNYGKIINISSEGGKKAWSTGSSYCSSKFGMLGLTEASASDVKDKEININAICPSGVDTPLVRKSYPKLDFANIKLMESEDISKVVLFIASEEAKAIKGSFISVSAGQTLIDGNE